MAVAAAVAVWPREQTDVAEGEAAGLAGERPAAGLVEEAFAEVLVVGLVVLVGQAAEAEVAEPPLALGLMASEGPAVGAGVTETPEDLVAFGVTEIGAG